MKVQQGFTLIELMIVVAIIAIISAIAYPSYQDSVRKTNRTDGISAMQEAAQRLERCFTTNGSYIHANCPYGASDTFDSPKGHYTITVTATQGSYTITGTPKSASQLKDTGCTKFQLTQTGMKTAEGSASDRCW